MVETPLSREQVTEVPPGDALVVTPKDVPDSSVDVSAGRVVLANGTAMYVVEAQESSPFPALSGIGYRWDLLCVDVSGSAPLLKGPADDVSLKGVESGTLPYWYDPALGIPDIPVGYMPLAAILVTETSPNPVLIVEGDIVDLRPFFKSAQATGGTTAYAAGTPGDWIVLPTTVGAGLDELADRLNTDVSPQEVRGSVGVPGSSKVAARADHAHCHGELGNTGTVLWNHITQQVGHARGPVNYWEGSLQASSWERLEELARRNRILEDAFFEPYEDTVTGDRTGSSVTWFFTNTRQASLVGSGNEFWYDTPSEHYYLEQLHVCIFDETSTEWSKHMMSFLREGMYGPPGGNYNGRVVSLGYTGGSASSANDTAVDIVIPTTGYNPFAFIRIVSAGATWDVKMKKDGNRYYVWLDDTPSGWDTAASHAAILEARAVFSVDYDNYSP